MSELFRPSTFRHFVSLGVGPGWRCWEGRRRGAIGAPVAGVRVGPAGHVVAHRHRHLLVRGGVRRRDRGEPPGRRPRTTLPRALRSGPRPVGLVHVTDRRRGAAGDGRVPAPGGWLTDRGRRPHASPLSCPDVVGPDQQLANKLRNGFRELMAGGSRSGLRRTAPPPAPRRRAGRRGGRRVLPSPGPGALTSRRRRSNCSGPSCSTMASPATARSTATWITSPTGASTSPSRR